MNQEALFHLVEEQQRRVGEACRQAWELGRSKGQAGSSGSEKWQRLVNWLRWEHPSIGVIRFGDLED